MQSEAFVSYAGFISDIKKTYSRDYLPAQHALGVNVKSYDKWDKNDMIALYDSYFGKQVFNHLARLVRQARKEEMARVTGSDVISFAQHDLNQIAPAGATWREYDVMMREAVAEIKATSMRLTSDLAALFEESEDAADDHAIAPTEFGMRGMQGFDQQAALAAMESRTALRAAAPKSTVRDAVTSLKNALARAS